jgi:glycosyltransferase involved in cell wall biosynthesis
MSEKFRQDAEVGWLRQTARLFRRNLVRCWHRLRDSHIRAYQRTRDRVRRVLGAQLGKLHQHRPRPLRLPPSYGRQELPADPPLISIVTPSYNQGAYLERTLQSVLGQDYPRLQYIVQDGGSSDDSPEVLRRYRPYLAHAESAKDRGQTHALNLGFAHATGDVLAYLNSDDLLLPGALAYVAAYFAAHPEVDVVYSHRVVIDERDREVGRWVLPPHEDAALLWRDFVPQETLFWRRRVWQKVGARFDEGFRFAMDWDLLLRLRAAGATFARVPRFLAAFRVHSEQKTSTIIRDVGEEEIRRLEAREHGRRLSDDEIHRAIRPYVRRHVLHDRLHRLARLACRWHDMVA